MVDSLQGRSSTAVDDAPPPARRLSRTGPAPSPKGDRASGRRRIGRPWWWVTGAAAALGAASLLLARTPTFDPLTWAVWGRELAHGQLSTAGDGASFKPLPVLADALVATLRGDPTVVWVAVSRAAALLALALAFALGRRLGGLVAGGVAAVVLALSPGFAWLSGAGMAEPLEMAATLAAVLSWVNGRRGAAVAALTVLSLLRPEAWPLLAVAALVTAGASLRRLAGAVLLGALVLVAWFVPEYAGSGDLLRTVHRAGVVTNGGPGAARVPALALLGSVPDVLLTPMVVAAVATAVGYAVRAVRGGDAVARGVTLTTTVATVWLAILTVMTQAHYSTGAMRYLAPFIALLAVLAGCGCGALARLLRHRGTGAPLVRAAAAAVLAALAVTSALVAVGAVHRTADEELRAVGSAQRTAEALRAVVSAAGGRQVLNDCGPVTTGPYEVPLVAWTLHRHLSSVSYGRATTGTVVVVGSDPVQQDGLVARGSVERTPWTLRSTCPAVAGAGGAP